MVGVNHTTWVTQELVDVHNGMGSLEFESVYCKYIAESAMCVNGSVCGAPEIGYASWDGN